jgi:exonuclease III
MILIIKNIDLNVQIVRNDLQGRWILLNMKVDNKEIWLINLYGPNQDDPHFFKTIYTNLLNLQATNDQIIMVGDYNTVLSTFKVITLQTIITVPVRKSQILWTH